MRKRVKEKNLKSNSIFVLSCGSNGQVTIQLSVSFVLRIEGKAKRNGGLGRGAKGNRLEVAHHNQEGGSQVDQELSNARQIGFQQSIVHITLLCCRINVCLLLLMCWTVFFSDII